MIEEYVTVEPGTLIYVEATEPNSTRLFIRSLYPLEDIKKKEGWWNIFTITDKPVENAGMYIARIDRHTYDKDGHDMLIVSIVCPIPAQEVYDLFSSMEWHKRSIIQDIFLLSGKFSEKAALRQHYMDNNWLALYKMASQFDQTIDISHTGDHEVYTDYISKVVDLIISGKLSMVDAVKCLIKPTEFEMNEEAWVEKLEAIVDNIDNYTEHPALAEHIKKLIAKTTTWDVRRHIYIHLTSLHSKYVSAVINGHMDRVPGDDPNAKIWYDWHDPVYFDKLEAYLKFDAERKAKNKAAKKVATKKAKKAAAKAAKEANN